MGLTRKKITVRTKKGKTYQRSVMVRAEAIGKRAGGKKLNAMNPWEPHHVQHVNTTNSKLGTAAKAYGSSGPGSDHSWLAIAVGMERQRRAHSDGHLPESATAGQIHAGLRRMNGENSAAHIGHIPRAAASSWINDLNKSSGPRHFPSDMVSPHGPDHAYRVPQDPRKHVR